MEEAGSRLSNGRFAPGHSRLPKAGRTKGTSNKTTRAIKEFLAALADDAEVQGAVRERIVSGDAVAFFRAVDHVLGKPKESVELTANVDIAARLEAARKRLVAEDKRMAEAKRG
jgi:hypothetical protein